MVWVEPREAGSGRSVMIRRVAGHLLQQALIPDGVGGAEGGSVGAISDDT